MLEDFFETIEKHKDAACWVGLLIFLILMSRKSKD